MNRSEPDSFLSLSDALDYVGLTSGLQINESLLTPESQSIWPYIVSLLPLILGSIGLICNILAIIIFSRSKTFLKSSFRYYIYAFVVVNCTSILTHSWLYLLFYLINPTQFCKYLRYIQQSTSSALLCIMVLLSLERALAFSRPFAIKRFLQSRNISFVLVMITCACFFIHINELLSVDILAYRWVNFAYGICSIKGQMRLSTDRFKMILHAQTFLLPFLLNSILDVYICFKICQRRRRLASKSRLVPPLTGKTKKKQRRSKSLAHEITLTLLCQSLWLLVTYFPMHLFYFFISFKLINDHDRDNSTQNFILRLNLLIFLAFSPTLYVIFSPTLRKEVLSYMRRLYKRHKLTRISQKKAKPIRKQDRKSPVNPHLTILILATESTPTKIHTETSRVPDEHLSFSAPCLLHLLHDNENGTKNLDRSNSCHPS